MSSAIEKFTPAGYTTLNPYLTVRNVPALIEFLQRTFGGVLAEKIEQPDGRIEHAEVRIGDSLLMIGPPEVDALIRTHDESRPGTFYVFVPDVDAAYRQALACSAAAWVSPTETFYGDRVAAVTDTNSNVWWLATRRQPLSAEELQARADQHWHRKATAGAAAQDGPPAAASSSRAPADASPGTTPPGYQSVNCYLTIEDVKGLIGFLQQAFGGVLAGQIRQPDGGIEHAEVRIGDSVLMIGPPQVDGLIRTGAYHRPSTFYLFVADVDEACRKAADCGARIIEAPSERFYGDRVAALGDAYGNHWWIATRKEALAPNELQERADERWHARSHSASRTVTKAEVLEFIGRQRYGVEATVTAAGTAEAALVGFVVNDQLELFFDTFSSTRKAANLKRDPRISFVIGGHADGDERTVQYEGSVDTPTGAELDAWKQAYFARYPDGVRRARLPGITYFRVRPRWLRYTNFNASPPQIAVFEGAVLTAEQQAPGAPAAAHYVQIRTSWQPQVAHDEEFNAFANTTRAQTEHQRSGFEQE
jgi:uncharacterized glyoxalase superfamily protein PhnB/general stress protein 26